MKRPKKLIKLPNKPKALDPSLTMQQLEAIAARVSYDPSPYHCPDRHGRYARRGKPAMPCPEGWNKHQALLVLREAVREGNVSRAKTGDFPRYVWRQAGEIWFEATTKNGSPGEYHAYPIEEVALPKGLRP